MRSYAQNGGWPPATGWESTMETTTKITADQCRSNESYVSVTGVRFRIADLRPKFGYWSERTYWSAGVSPEGTPGRRAFGGPQVLERFGWLNADPVVIAAHPLAEAPVVELHLGDAIDIEGHGSWRVAMTGGWDSRPTIEPI